MVDEDALVQRLLRYFDPSGPFAGASFLGLNPNTPARVEPSDLLAVMSIGIRVPAVAIRRIIESTADSRHINSLLATPQLDPTFDLLTAGAPTLAAMAGLRQAVHASLSSAGMSPKARSAVAAALCARKRPHLFPLYYERWADDGQPPTGEACAVSWQVHHALLDDKALIDRLERTLDLVRGGGADIGDRTALLHHLGVALRGSPHPC